MRAFATSTVYVVYVVCSDVACCVQVERSAPFPENTLILFTYSVFIFVFFLRFVSFSNKKETIQFCREADNF